MPRPLHPDVVIHIRRYHAAGYSIGSLATALNISKSAIFNVVHYKTHTRVVDTGRPLRRLKTNALPIGATGLTTEHAKAIEAEISRAAHEAHRLDMKKQKAEAAENAAVEVRDRARAQAEADERAKENLVHWIAGGSVASAGKYAAYCGKLVDVKARDAYAYLKDFQELVRLGVYVCAKCQGGHARRYARTYG